MSLLNQLGGPPAGLPKGAKAAAAALKVLGVGDLYGIADQRGRTKARAVLLEAMDRALRKQTMTDEELEREETSIAKSGEEMVSLQDALARAQKTLRIEPDSPVPRELTRRAPLSHRVAFSFYFAGLADDAVVALLGDVDETALAGLAAGLRDYAKKSEESRPGRPLQLDVLCGYALQGAGLISVKDRTEFFRGAAP